MSANIPCELSPTLRSQTVPLRLRSASTLLFAFALCSIHVESASAQTRFTDDAQRTITLPAHPARVFAAGAPAEVLLYTLVPDMLVGRNHMPPAAALEFMPPTLRSPK